MTNPIYDGNLWSGSIWYSGTATPVNDTGVNGDYYLKTSDGQIYKKELGVWSSLVNLTGLKGDTGNTGAGTADGGAARQLLTKLSSGNYDTGWRAIDSTDIETALGYVPLESEADTLQTVTARGSSTSSQVIINNGTASTSSSTGALIVNGGIGANGTIHATEFDGSFTGNLIGNVTGTLYGNVVGSISGNAATVTHGVYTTGSYTDPSWLTLTSSKLGLGNVTNESKATMFASPTFTGTPVAPTALAGTNNTQVATTAFVKTAVDNLVNAAPSALDTLNELALALGSDANFSTTITNALALKAPLASPIFSGTVSFGNASSVTGLTPSTVGLGNVSNESKSTMFTSPTFTGTMTAATATFTGTATLQQTTEALNTKTGATGTVAHDYLTGAIWYHSSITANFTANFTNIPTTDNKTVALTLILSQGATAYIPNALQIDGSVQTIKWLGSTTAPVGNASKIDIVNFTLIRTSAAWTVLGSLTSFG